MRKVLTVVDGQNCYNTELHNKLVADGNTDITVMVGKGQKIKDHNKKKVKVMEVDVGYKNSLDFTLIGYVVDSVVNRKYDNVIIVSNDKGFDSCIKFLRERGYKIARKNSKLNYVCKYIKNEEEFKEVCNFIGKNMNPGVKESTILKVLVKRFGNKAYVNLKKLEKMNYVVRDRKKIYFDNRELMAVGKSEIEIGDYY